jgi:predicted CopG family antitoxin
MVEKRLIHIAVDEENYEALSGLGSFHESFNDIIRRLLLESNKQQQLLLQQRKKGDKERVPQGATVASQKAPSGRKDSSNALPTTEEELAHHVG